MKPNRIPIALCALMALSVGIHVQAFKWFGMLGRSSTQTAPAYKTTNASEWGSRYTDHMKAQKGEDISEDNFETIPGKNDDRMVATPSTIMKNKFLHHIYVEGKTECGVRAHEKYTPADVNPNAKPIVIVLVHGTFAQNVDDYHIQGTQLYESVRDFAKSYANDKKAAIELVSLRWSGVNSSQARRNGGMALASLLIQYYSNHEIITISHSHGCNLVNKASRQLGPWDVMIDRIIHFATPVRDATEADDFEPLNFKRLVQFYSTSDLIGALGALTEKNAFVRKGSIRKYEHQDGRMVMNVRTQVNGFDPGHSNVKGVLVYLDKALKVLDTFVLHTDLDLDINFKAENAENPVLVSARHNVIFNSEDQSSEKYNSLKQAILLNAVNSRGELTSDEKKALERTIDIELAQRFAYEARYSEAQKAVFKERYGKTMGKKNGLFSRLATGIWEETHVNF
jgi:hypothetical protein